MAANDSKSKRPSGANSKSQLPDSPTFFLDRSLGRKKVAIALRAAGATVRVHDDHFAPDARDEDWLLEVGRKNWVVLTKDKRIRHRAPEFAALRRTHVTAFVLTAGNLTGDQMATVFVKALRRMVRTVRTQTKPLIAAVRRDGSLKILS